MCCRHLRRDASRCGFFFLRFLIFASLGSSSFAATTTVTFDQFPDGTVLTNQYQRLGVTIAGGTVFATNLSSSFPPISAPNVAYAPSGQITISFNSTVAGNVMTVSAYVTDPGGPAGIYAYGSSNALLGQAVLPGTGGTNALLTVTSTGNPVAYVIIHDGGGSFSIDNFSFTVPAATPLPVSFQAAASYLVSGPPNPTLPYSVAIADFNADGKVDLAVADGQSGNGSIDLLFGNGDGTFGSASSFFIGTGLASFFLTTADFNRDGQPDLVVAYENGTAIGVLLGNTNPTVTNPFQPLQDYGNLGNPISIAVSDFNNDGNPDLAVVNETGNSVSILLGSSTGTFAAQVPYKVGNSSDPAPNSVAAGDFNGDGNIDLAVVNPNENSFSILLGQGDGSFQPQTTYSLAQAGTPLSPYSIATYDFNGDGRLDLAITNYFGNNVSVLLGNGDGTFQAAMNYGVGMTPYSVAVGDINGDNRADVVVANYGSNNISVLLGNGDGTFLPAQNFTVGSNPTSVTIKDLNGDGKLDLVVPNSGSSNVSVLLNTTPSTGSASTSTTLTSSLNPSVFDQSVTLTATVTSSSGTPTGSVAFNDGATALGTVAVGATGQAALSTSSLTAGTHSITAVYTPTGSFIGSTSTALTQTVKQATPAITWSTPAAIIYGGALSATQLNATANVAGSFSYSPAVGTVLNAGTQILTAAFSPSDATDYTGASATVSQVVSQATSSVVVSSNANPSSTGQVVTFTASITPQLGGTAAGSVTFYDGTTALGTMTVSSNAAALSTSALATGTHSITAAYSGDANVLAGTSSALSQVVSASQITTTTTLVSSINPAYETQTVVYTATVSAASGVPTGSVTFHQGFTTLAVVALVNGQATYSTAYATPGTRFITAGYAANTPYLASTSSVLAQSVTRVPTTIVVVTSPSPQFVGLPVTITATLSSPAGAPKDGETVTFRDRGTAIGTGTTSGGAASITTSSLSAGIHSITAQYPGDTTYSASTSVAISQVISKYATSTSVVSSANPSTYGQPVTFTATVTPTGSFALTGTVTFRSGNFAFATVTLGGGTASYTTSSLTVGTKFVSAIYNGDANNAQSASGLLSQVVNQVATTTSLTSTPNPSTLGSPVTFTATVTSSGGTPGGSVTFRQGTTLISRVLLNAAGVATITTSSLPQGNTSVTATFSGSANFSGSSGSTTQTVN
jgi:hypothetical protein